MQSRERRRRSACAPPEFESFQPPRIHSNTILHPTANRRRLANVAATFAHGRRSVCSESAKPAHGVTRLSGAVRPQNTRRTEFRSLSGSVAVSAVREDLREAVAAVFTNLLSTTREPSH